MLIHCKKFINLFIENFSKIKADDKYISTSFYNILISMLYSNNNEKNNIDISSFLYLFIYKHTNFRAFFQHDTQEFCKSFIRRF